MDRFDQSCRLIETIRAYPGIQQGAFVPVKRAPVAIGYDHRNRYSVEELAEAGFAAMFERLAFLLAQLRSLTPNGLFFFVKLDEHRDLRAQNLGLERLHQKIDGAAL